MEVDEIIKKRKERIVGTVKDFIKNNKTLMILLLIDLVIKIYFLWITKNQPIWWDAGAYLGTAKRWAGIGNLSDVWYYRRGFLFPLICSLFYGIGFGEIGIRIAIVFASVGFLLVSYLLISEMINKRLAIYTVAAMIGSWVILFFSMRPLTYMPSPLILFIALLFFWKGYMKEQGNHYIYLFALFFAFSVFMRMQNLMFAPVFLIAVILKDKWRFIIDKRWWVCLFIFGLVIAPVLVIYSQHYGNPVTDITSYYLGIGKSDLGVEKKTTSYPFAYFKDIPYQLFGSSMNNITGNLLIMLIVGSIMFFGEILLGINFIFKNKKIQTKLFIFMWIVVFYILMGHLSGDAIFQGYIIPAIPFLFMLFSFPFFTIEKNYKIKLMPLFLLVIIVPNMMWAGEIINIKLDSYGEIKSAGDWIREHSNINDIVISSSYPQIAYYSERKTYPFGVAGEIPEDKIPRNESEFHQYVLEEKPRYIVLSAIQRSEDWAYNYPIKHKESWQVVNILNKGEQPILAIYENKNFQPLMVERRYDGTAQK